MHKECVTEDMLSVLDTLVSHPYIRSNFSLGGGTALALQLGHRLSVDIDLIAEGSFETDELEHFIHRAFPDSGNTIRGEFGFFAKVNNIKTDFLTWNIPYIRKWVEIDGVQMLHVEEIAAMKLFAILQRREKKDYWDVATLLEKYTLQHQILFLRKGIPGMMKTWY